MTASWGVLRRDGIGLGSTTSHLKTASLGPFGSPSHLVGFYCNPLGVCLAQVLGAKRCVFLKRRNNGGRNSLFAPSPPSTFMSVQKNLWRWMSRPADIKKYSSEVSHPASVLGTTGFLCALLSHFSRNATHDCPCE